MKIKKNLNFLLLVLLLFILYFYSWPECHIPIEIESNRDNRVDDESIRIENISENFFEINENMNSQHQIYFSNKRKLKKKNEFYLVLEYTRIFGNTKYCQMKMNSNAFKNYKNLSLMRLLIYWIIVDLKIVFLHATNRLLIHQTH